MCIRDRGWGIRRVEQRSLPRLSHLLGRVPQVVGMVVAIDPVSYTHLRAHETVLDLVCRLLLEKKKRKIRIKTRNKKIHS